MKAHGTKSEATEPRPDRRGARAARRLLGPALLGLAGALALGACGDDGTPDPGGADRPAEPAAQGTPAKDGELPDYYVGPQAGRWHEPRTNRDLAGLTEEQREQTDELEALGYAASTGLEAEELPIVTRYDAARAWNGVSLYTSAHAADARLIDMNGKVLHEWSYPFEKVWPDYPGGNKHQTFWRRTYLFPNGDLIAIYEGLGIIKLDKDSKLLWKNALRVHHDLVVLPDGRIWVLVREARPMPAFVKNRVCMEDFITQLTPDGREVDEKARISLPWAIENGGRLDLDWEALAESGGGDLLHTNSLALLDGRLADVDPAFRAGNFLVSMLLPSLVCVVDPERKQVVWGKRGPYEAQHDPHVIDVDGKPRVLVFDNQGGDGGDGKPASRVLELDPATWEPAWTYEGSPSDPFYSETCGLAQRLPNGNTLITETDYGRAFEVTREGDVVWEFNNPHRAGPGGRFVATLMEVLRLPEDFPLDWTTAD